MDFQHMLNTIWDFFQTGFHEVNAVEGLVIALVAALLVPAWSRLWAVALGATVVTLVVNTLIPVIAYHQSFRLPPDLLEVSYWMGALALFAGYLVVIGVFFFIKRLFLRSE
ncbi:MAG TPA: hypothetical protein VGG48_17530 [Rhizomicrobium sp.]|jgi:hypothetical protein